MSGAVEVLAGIGVVVFVIARQLMGEPLRGKRVVLLPLILTVIGGLDLGGSKAHLQPVDIGCLVVGGLAVAGVGMAQGLVTRLEKRDGYLWGQLPVRGLWLWGLLVAVRVVMTIAAHGLGAEVAGSSSTILLMLGISRLGQAAVVLPRAMAANIPFAPEKDGTSFLAALTGSGSSPSTAPPGQTAPRDPEHNVQSGGDWPSLGRQAMALWQNRRDQSRRGR